MGYVIKAGSELEYYVLRDSWQELADQGWPTPRPFGYYNEDYHLLQATKAEPLHRLLRNQMADARIPIEFSKGGLRMLSAEHISERLDDRFRLLTGGSRTALPRQQTLRALIDWSYDLLSENERTLLRRLAVFTGGCTLEAVEQVCSDDSIHIEEILDLLTHLVDKSLLAVEDESNHLRYRMLETVHQYAREKILESGEGEKIRTQHLAYFLKFAEEAEPHLTRTEQLEWLAQLEQNHDNFRVALDWANQTAPIEPPDAYLRLACALYKYSPASRELCIRSDTDAYRHGLLAYAWDARLLTRPWGFKLDEIKIPVHLWHGNEDNSTTMAMARYMADTIPNGHLTICEDEAHMLLIPHWEEILTTLKRMSNGA